MLVISEKIFRLSHLKSVTLPWWSQRLAEREGEGERARSTKNESQRISLNLRKVIREKVVMVKVSKSHRQKKEQII